MRSENPVVDAPQGLAGQADITVLPAAHPPQPALDLHLLAWPVHGPVIKDVPAQFVLDRSGLPDVAAPQVGRLGQDGCVVAPAGYQQGCFLAKQLKCDRAIVTGDRYLVAGIGLDGHASQRGAILQPVGPDHHLAVVRERVEADLGHLHPSLNDAAVPVSARQKALWFDNDHKLAGCTLQRRTQVDAHFSQGVGLGLQVDGFVHHPLAGRLGRLALPVVLLKIAPEGRPV